MSAAAPERPNGRRAPGRPRSAAVHQALIDATLELLADVGYRGLTVEAVSQRAGASKATVYRRWPSKVNLVVDALSANAARQVGEPDTGSVREDLLVLLRGLARFLTEPLATAFPSLLAEAYRHPELGETFRNEFVSKRRAVIRRVVERGVQRGEVRTDADLDVVVDNGAAHLFYRFLISGEPMDPELPERIVDHMLRGVHA